MLNPMGRLMVPIRRGKRVPQNLDIPIENRRVGLNARINEYLSIASYFFHIILELSFKRLLGLLTDQDVIYTNFEYSGLVGLWGKEVLGMKWIADFFDDPRRGYLNAVSREASPWRVRVEKAVLSLYRRYLKDADLVVCNAPDRESGLAAVLRQRFRVPVERLVTVPGGVSPDYIEKCLSNPALMREVEAVLQERGLQNADYLYLVGYINSSVSGVRDLLRALKALHAEGIFCHLVLAGVCKPRELAWLRTSVRALNLESHVHYLGEVDQRLSYLLIRRAISCVCPYNINGREDYQTAYPIKLLEYLAIGAPTVTVETPVTRRIVTDFGRGELVPAGLEQALARAIKAIAGPGVKSQAKGAPAQYHWDLINKTLQREISRVVAIETENSAE